MNWYFIRHGEISSNKAKIYSGRSDEELTETGCKQVREASRGLVAIDIDAIYCSPLIRTRQTAEIVVDELGWTVPIKIDESFNELKMGPWEGMAESEVEKQYPEEWAIWNKTPANLALEGRETLTQLQDRVIDGIKNISRFQSYKNILVVTHVAIIRVIYLHSTRKELNKYKSIEVNNAKIFNFRNLLIATAGKSA